MTYSIVARDPATGQMGVAVQSHAFSVGSIVTFGEAGVGVVATQSMSRREYGPEGLDLMRMNIPAPLALETLLRTDEARETRQVAMLDTYGRVAVHTGAKCIQPAGHIVGENFSVQANLMRNDTIWDAMAEAYTSFKGKDFGERLLAALDAAELAGGDVRGMQSSALLIVDGERGLLPWSKRPLELRVEDHAHPLEELRRLYNFRRADRDVDSILQRLFAGEIKGKAALPQIEESLTLVPETSAVEYRFWVAAYLYKAKAKKESLQMFRDVFTQQRLWLDLLPELARLELVPNDAEALAEIRAQAVPNS